MDVSIVVYTKNNCVQCNATKRALGKYGLDFEEINLDADGEALEAVKELGYLQAPVVMANGEHWAGFRPDKLKALAAAQAAVGAARA